MDVGRRVFLVSNIKLSVNASHAEAFSVALAKLKKSGVSLREPTCSVYRRSVDARKRTSIMFVYTIAVSAFSNAKAHFVAKDIAEHEDIKPEIITGTEPLVARPMVVGTGPCGLFAALLLAKEGYKPIVIERGGCVSDRLIAREKFNTLRILDPENNVQFGAGGAGTFSDGKLVTRIADPLTSYVLDALVEFGAPEEIRFVARPHVGTDVLANVVDQMLSKIAELGGEVLYNTKLIDFTAITDKITAVKTTKGDFKVGALVLAIGHSARDTYEMLLSKNLSIEAKSFSVGMRIEHLTKAIDRAMYGDFAGSPALGHAEYNLSHDTKNRGVYTFCMCPGGEVVAAASEEGGVVVNGMSNSKRDGLNSNSAVVCSIFREDYGATPEKAINFQRKIEKNAYFAGSSDYSAPIITVGDFLSDNLSHTPSRVQPTYMNGEHVRLARPTDFLPEFVCNSIKGALVAFDKRISGFASSDAVLTGAETRTSAPVRILRDSETRLALGYNNLYPAGEGAGYAGGITSAAIDGIKTALSLIKRYHPIDG